MVHSKPFRSIAATVVTVGVLFGASSCASPQTLQPYTQAEGVNYDAPMAGQQVPLKVRNLMVVAKPGGQGFISGAVISTEANKLTGVEAQALDASGAPGAPIPPATANVEMKPNQLVVLTEGSPIQLNSPDLKPGLTARLKLTFEKGAPAEVVVPIVDGEKEDYKTMEPMQGGGGGESSPSAEATPAPAGEATPAAPGAEPPAPTPGG